MKVSVVIPAYNEEKNIARTIASLKNQTEAPDEIIVVDNNCQDKTAEIAQEMGARVVKETTQGMIPARNRGFIEAKYEILARTDADTEVSPTWIARIKQDLSDSSYLAVSGPAAFGSSFLKPFIRMMFLVNKRLFGHYVLYGPNMALRKSIWETIKNEVCLNDEEVHEDVDLGIHIGMYGKIMFDPKLQVKTSARRVKNPTSFFIHYNKKWVTTIQHHKKTGILASSTR